jgi:hypothetical protein
MLSVIQNKAGVLVKPLSYLFPWLIRQAAFIINKYKKRRDGTTPYHACTSKTYVQALAQFGEKVHYNVQDIHTYGKSAPKSYYGIWVGINDVDKCHIVLTPAGVVQARVVKRVAEDEMWDKELLAKVVGVPWNKSAGGEGGVQIRLRSETTTIPLPE